jgi:hypothetical protein
MCEFSSKRSPQVKDQPQVGALWSPLAWLLCEKEDCFRESLTTPWPWVWNCIASRMFLFFAKHLE